MTSRKLIVFDFDGTLIDSQASLDKGLIEFSVMKGLPYDTVKMARGYIDPLKYDLGWGLPLDAQPALFEEMAQFQSNQLAAEDSRLMPEFFPHALDVVDELNQRYDLAIVTARDRHTTRIILKHHRAYDYFPAYRTLCCARERGYAIKPAPDALQCLLRDTKHTPSDVIVVGDTSSDIRMAHAAGSMSIAALWGFQPRDYLEEVNPTVMLESIQELPKTIADLFSSR